MEIVIGLAGLCLAVGCWWLGNWMLDRHIAKEKRSGGSNN